MKSYELNGVTYIQPETADEVTEEMIDLARQTHDSWFDDGERIDWNDFLDRLCSEGYLADGSRLDFDTYDSAAVRKIQKTVREWRRQ